MDHSSDPIFFKNMDGGLTNAEFFWRDHYRFLEEKGYKLRKDLFAFTDNKIAVQVRSSSSSSCLPFRWYCGHVYVHCWMYGAT